MGKIAFVFAGQGAQFSGMGKELAEVSAAARDVFDRAQRLMPGLLELCFTGTDLELAVTKNTQPCLFTMDLACAMALIEQGIMPKLCAGFSLGETAAAAFTGMLTFDEAFAFVTERARLMQSCAEANEGFMAAILRLDNDAVEALCKTFNQVWPVNFNAPGQVVVSGAIQEKEAFLKAVSLQGGRALPLKVSGAFHSPLMAKAAQALHVYLSAVNLKRPCMPLYANKTALPYNRDAVTLLSHQVDHPVLWEETIINMASAGADIFVELGPGTVLSGLIRKILPNATVLNVQDPQSLAQSLAILREVK